MRSVRKEQKEEAEIMGVADDCRKNFVVVVDAKANYAEKEGDHWLIRSEGGILIPATFDEQHVINRQERDEAKRQKKTDGDDSKKIAPIKPATLYR